MQEHVADLRKENQVLREQLATAGSLCYRSNCYWRDNHPDPGPFCARCWDVERQLIHLNPTFDPRVLGCPRCRSAVDISGPADSAESLPPRSTTSHPPASGRFQDAPLYPRRAQKIRLAHRSVWT